MKTQLVSLLVLSVPLLLNVLGSVESTDQSAAAPAAEAVCPSPPSASATQPAAGSVDKPSAEKTAAPSPKSETKTARRAPASLAS